MQTVLDVLQMALPVAMLIGIGQICRTTKLMSEASIDGCKALISNILIPIMLFDLMAGLELSGEMVWIVVISLAMNAAAFGLGFLLKKLTREQSRYFPYLMAGFEVGLLGLALFPLIFGQDSLGYLATMDLGNCLFFCFLMLPSMQAMDAGAGEKKSLKQTLKTVFTTPPLIGCLLGLLCNLTGLIGLLQSSALAPVYDACAELGTRGLTPLILIVVGWGMSFNKGILGKVIKTCVLRAVSLSLVCLMALGLFRLAGITDPLATYSVIMMCAVSAPYVCSVYAKDVREREYINTQLSMHVFVTILVFIVLSIVAR